MAHMPGLKHLRVALVQGAKIIEARPLRKRVSVSVGQNATNTFVVPVSNLPQSFVLFELVNDQYHLIFRPDMEGNVALDGNERVPLQKLREQGHAKPRRDAFALPLNDSSKGRVSLGEVSLLFQFVTPPPEPPKPELPANVKGSFFSQIDQFFFVILVASLFIHFTGATIIACQPVPEERELALEELPPSARQAMMPIEKKKEPEKAQLAEKKEDKKEEKKEDKKEASEKKAEKVAASAAEQKAELQAKVAKSGLLKVIGSGQGGGAFEDVLGASSGVGDVASALSGASGVGVATADSLAAGGPKGGGAGNAASIGELGTSGGGNVALAEKGTAAIRGGVSMQTPEVESADVDREKLTSFVRARKGAIQQCYERELKRNQTLRGKIVVRFTITTQGRASEIDIEENTLNNEAVSSCIKTVIRGWVFPFKPPSEVPVAYPFVFAPSN